MAELPEIYGHYLASRYGLDPSRAHATLVKHAAEFSGKSNAECDGLALSLYQHDHAAANAPAPEPQAQPRRSPLEEEDARVQEQTARRRQRDADLTPYTGGPGSEQRLPSPPTSTLGDAILARKRWRAEHRRG